MKKKYFWFYVIALVMALGMSACSSSSDDNGGGSDNPQSIAGVYSIDTYTLTFYDNSTFSATDNATGKNYTGSYTYNAPDLILSGVVATRAFSLEEGKTYSFNVERVGKSLVLTNKETGEVMTLDYVAEAPSADEQLTPDEERAYIEATARSLETYFVANEWQIFTDAANEIRDVEGGEMEQYLRTLVTDALIATNTYESESYSYDRYDSSTGTTYYHLYTYISKTEYYDRLIAATNAKGQFEASYNSKRWVQTGSADGLRATYTDSKGAVWVLNVTHSGSTGKIRLDEWKYRTDSYNKYTGQVPTGNVNLDGTPERYEYIYEREDILIDVPTYVDATLTCNGEVKNHTVVNISKFLNATDEHSQLSFLGQAAGTVDVMIQPTGEAFNVHVDFDYINNANSIVNATVKRGNTELVNVAVNATPQASAPQEMDKVVNGSATVTVLNRLTAHLTVTEGKSVYEAYHDANNKRNRYNEEVVKNCANVINNSVSAYITNGPTSTVNQGTLRVAVKGKQDYQGTRYELYPTLNFADGSSYAFEDYFTEAYFKSVIDYAEQLGKDFERMLKKTK